MTDLDILQLINARIADLAEDTVKYKREIRELRLLKKTIESRIASSLDHQAQREMQPR